MPACLCRLVPSLGRLLGHVLFSLSGFKRIIVRNIFQRGSRAILVAHCYAIVRSCASRLELQDVQPEPEKT